MSIRKIILAFLSLLPALGLAAADEYAVLVEKIEGLRQEGGKLDEVRDFQGSLVLYQTALTLAQKAKDDWRVIDCLRDAAGSAAALRLTPLAQTYFTEAMNVARDMGSQHAQAMNRRLEAVAWAGLGYMDEARKAAEEALNYKRSDEISRLDLADYLLEAAEAQRAAGDPAFALMRLNELRQLPQFGKWAAADRHRFDVTNAHSLFDLGNSKQAVLAFKEAVVSARALGDPWKMAQALTLLAHQSDGPEAEKILRELLQLGRSQKHNGYIAFAQVELARGALDEGSLEAAQLGLAQAELALDLDEDLDFRASLWIQQARLKLKQGDVAAARALFEKAKQLSRQRGHCDDEVEADLVLSRGLKALKQMNEALLAGREAVQRARECGLKDKLPHALNEFASLASDLGHSAEAHAATQEGRQASLNMSSYAQGQRQVMAAYFGQLVQAIAVSDYQAALEAANQGLSIARLMKDEKEESHFLVKQGDALRYLGKTEAAVEAYEAALAVKTHTLQTEVDDYFRRMVEYHLAGLKKSKESRQSILEDLMLRAQYLGLHDSWAKMASDLADLHLEQGHPQDALLAAETGLEKLRLGDDAYLLPFIAAQLWEAQGRAWMILAGTREEREAKIGALKHAVAALRASVNLDDEQRAGIEDEEGRIQFSQERIATRERLTDCLLQLYELEADTTWSGQALAVADFGKARLLAEQLQDAQARRSAGLPRNEARQLRQLEARVSELAVDMAKAQVKGGIKRTRKAWMEARAQRQALRQRLKESFPAYAAMKDPPRLDLKSLRGRLGPDEALLEMAALNGKLLLWWVSPTSFEFRVIENARIFDALADHYQTRLSKAKLEPDRVLGQDLVDMIFGNWKPRLASLQRLYVVADGKAVGLPLQALPSPRPGHYLVEDLEFCYLQSAALLPAKAKASTSWDMNLFVLGNPDLPRPQVRIAQARGSLRGNDPGRNVARFFDELKTLENLEGAEAEAMALQQLAPERSTMLLKSEALESAVKRSSQQGQLARYRYLHFASHGMLCDSAPQLSSLVLTGDQHDDGLLSAGEVLGLNLSSDLVTLSACELGLGKQLRGEGTLGMTRAFMAAGAATVVVSLWAVYDNATRELMLEFYKGLGQGQSKSAALRSAQLSLLKGGQWVKPVFWAPFVLYGAAE